MVENFASFHVLGENRKNIQCLISALNKTPELARDLTAEQQERLESIKQQVGEDFISEFKKNYFYEVWLKRPLVGIQSDSGYSFYSPCYEMDSIEYEIKTFWGYMGSPLVLGVGVEDSRYLRLCIYENCKIKSDWLVDLKTDIAPRCDHKPRWKNIQCFEKYFGITKNDFKNAIVTKSLPYVFLHLKRFFDFPIQLSYDDIISNPEKYNADIFFKTGARD